MKVRVICKTCGKSIYMNITPENLEDSKGGIFRVACRHNCNGKIKAVLAFVDQDLSVRGQEICAMVEAEENE